MILRDTRMIPGSFETIYMQYNLNKTGTKSLKKHYKINK